MSFEWKECSKAWGIRFYPNDLIQLGDEAMKLLYDKVGLVMGEMKVHAQSEWDGAVEVLMGKAEYQRNDLPAMTSILDEVYNFNSKRDVDVHIACFILNNADFRELPDKFLVKWVDNKKGQVKLDNLDVIKYRKVNKKFQKEWNLFLEVLPTITFTFDEMRFYKLGCSI